MTLHAQLPRKCKEMLRQDAYTHTHRGRMVEEDKGKRRREKRSYTVVMFERTAVLHTCMRDNTTCGLLRMYLQGSEIDCHCLMVSSS